jgi:hypothetical protein
MKFLSFDIGIKNLAYCISEFNEETKKVEIIEWDIINLLCDFFEKQEKCHYINRKKCTKKAEYKNNNGKFYCKTHVKKYQEQHETTLSNLVFKTKKEKTLYIRNNKFKKFKVAKCKDYPLDDLCDIIINTFDNKFPHFKNVDIVLIELQLIKSPQIKTVSNIIYTYFKIRGQHSNTEHKISNISFYRATNKLMFYDNEKCDIENYKQRKNTAIDNVMNYLKQNEDMDNLKLFTSHSKKDDLADALLQILSYLHKNNKI